MSLYNCADLAELEQLRADPRGTELVDTSCLTFNTGMRQIGEPTELMDYNGFEVYVLTIDGNTAEIFIP